MKVPRFGRTIDRSRPAGAFPRLLPEATGSRVVRVGAGLTLLTAALLLTGPLASPALAATLKVDTTADSGPGSLRQAILDANATTTPDTIKFAISPAGPHVITPTSPLPVIMWPVTINGRSEPGYAGTPLIQLDNGTGDPAANGLDVVAGASKVLGLSFTNFGVGIRLSDGDADQIKANWLGLDVNGAAAGNRTGLEITAGSASNVVGGASADKRNVISGNSESGIKISGAGATGNIVKGNFVGTDVTGASAVANAVGVFIDDTASGNTIGGTSSGARNVISGSPFSGVEMFGIGTSGNIVAGNYIGTDAAGSSAIPNDRGVLVHAGASGNTVGGTSGGARNVISGNSNIGVDILDEQTTGNTVEGNYIGTDAAGSAPLPNVIGVEISDGPSGNTVGGSNANKRNVISGNEEGVGIFLPGTTGNTVAGNYIGTDAAGSGALPNGTGVAFASGASGNTLGKGNVISGNTGFGVYLADSGTTDNAVTGNSIGTDASGGGALPNFTGVFLTNGASGNTVGGTGGASGNTIEFNSNLGVEVDGNVAATDGVSILGNSIDLNGFQGIGLFGGANHGQTAPSITSVQTSGGTTTIQGTLGSVASTNFRIELFSSPACDPIGAGEGRQFLGFVNVTTDAGGSASFSQDVPALGSGVAVTGTATNRPSGDSSEFSNCFTGP